MSPSVICNPSDIKPSYNVVFIASLLWKGKSPSKVNGDRDHIKLWEQRKRERDRIKSGVKLSRLLKGLVYNFLFVFILMKKVFKLNKRKKIKIQMAELSL